MTIDELRRLAAKLPRTPLAHLPTPLGVCPRFSDELGHGVQLAMKRDDLTGLGMGGNKLRKLEFSIGEAQANGCDVIVHGLAGQSNYCRQTAAAAAKVGMPCILVLRQDHKAENPPQANRLLDYLFGAEVRMVPSLEQAAAKELLIAELEAAGRKPYLVGQHDEVLGAVGYALCMAEILEQSAVLGLSPDCICVTGRSGTQAGLVLGKQLLGFEGEVYGFHPAPTADDMTSRAGCAKMATEAAALLGLGEAFSAEEINNTSAYGGAKYGVPTDECLDAALVMGRTEGLVLGPVYTAKGMAGVIDTVRTGQIATGSTVVFVHTGGTAETFAYNREIWEHLGGRQ
jgi:1-aminocyclopropane-1-carboxylate deaminase/D-cysteine desulfhydrase-like pyridoxal-dependent ACC family enzyme